MTQEQFLKSCELKNRINGLRGFIQTLSGIAGDEIYITIEAYRVDGEGRTRSISHSALPDPESTEIICAALTRARILVSELEKEFEKL